MKTRCKSMFCPHIQCEEVTEDNQRHPGLCSFQGLTWDYYLSNNDATKELEKLSKIVEPQYNHYFKNVTCFNYIDVYRVLELFEVTHPAIQHAIKKLLVPGNRGSKSIDMDIAEAIVSLQRYQQMKKELE